MSRDMSDNDDDISDVSMPEESDDSDSDEELLRESENRTDRRRLSLTLDYAHVNSAGQSPIASMMSDNDTGGMQTNGTQASSDLPRSDSPPRPMGGMFAAGFDSLPFEVWQNIFVFNSPKTLGSLLRVNKGINALLDPDSPFPEPATPHKRTHLGRRQPNDVWQLSRKRFRPRMPSPLEGMTELSIWRLACAVRCASCGKKAAPIASQDQWHCGPGEDGFRPIWAFAESACGPCLKGQTVKEIDLLLSASVPSTLICALPFVFMTNELHVVASTALHPGQQPPSSLQISKYFLKTDVENIKKEYFRIKSLGDAAAEEWIKGLDDRGRGKRVGSARWERWEAAGGLQRIRKDEPDNLQEQPVRQTLLSSLPPRPATFHGYSGFGQPPHIGNAYPPPPGVATRTGPVTSNFVPALPQRLDSPSLYGAYAPPGNQKAPRTKEEAERLKLARRAEIERRCGELDPPISPSVLVHMPSFQASLHIIKPLDGTAWDMLKPRILSQRADAEQRENKRLASIRVLQQAQAAPTPESIEREWEETQAIVKKRMGPYSDEIIRDGWGSGSKVTKETSPRFAAEVLIYVRKRFYAEIAKDDAAARIAGHPPLTDPLNGPFTRKLTMENMRWVFDTKIKAHTDKHRKEIFLCNACDTIKWYDFEGVCDHYAANHSGFATSGSIAVNWRAEWPEEPPFKPEPHLARRPTRTPVQTHNLALTPAPTIGYPLPPGVSMTQDVSNAPAPSAYMSHMPQPAQQPQFSDPYHQSAASYVAPGPYQPYQSAPPMQYSAGPSGSLYAPFYQLPAPELYSNPSMPLSHVSMPSHQAYFNSAPIESTFVPQQATPLSIADAQSHIPPPVYRTEAYKAQLQDMALTAKALWTETAGVKDMPGSVRVYVILFHVLQRLRERYTEDPPLSMLVDGIQNAKEMRVVRNVNGLACKTCKKENANKPAKPVNPYTMSSKATATPERKLYSLPQLVNHFQSGHTGGEAEVFGLDWRNDMVELPEKKKIKSLEHATGMDDHKLYLLREALPEAFKPDTPIVNNRDLAPSMDKHDLYYVPAKKPPPEVDMRRLLNPEMDNYPRLDRCGARSAAAAPSRPARGPSPEVDMTKLYNSAVDNYPHTHHRGRPSGGVAPYGGSQTHSTKRKATSPLGGRLGPVPTEKGRYLEANVVEGEEQEDADRYCPAHTLQSYLTRPEYNHHDVDLSRLLANAGHVSRSAQPQARPEEANRVTLQHPNAVAATKAAEQFLARMGGKSCETLLGSQKRPTDAPAVENREGANPPRSQYIASAVPENYRRRSPDEDRLRGGHGQGPPANPTGQEYIHEEARLVEYRPAHSQAPSREIRYAQPEVIRYADETRASGSPVYVVEELPHRRQYRAVSPGGQHYVDEQYEQRQEYYEYADEQPRPRQIQYEPEIEYIRVRDPGGDYLVEKPRHQPIYTRYEDSEAGRQPMYEDSRMRPVYEEEHIPVRVSQGSQRPRQIVYVDDSMSGAARYEDEEPVRYAKRQQSVAVRVDEDGAPIQYQEPPRPGQQIIYEDDPEIIQQAGQERNSLNTMAMSKNDPAYYEEYDPSNPAPLPVVPRRVQRHD